MVGALALAVTACGGSNNNTTTAVVTTPTPTTPTTTTPPPTTTPTVACDTFLEQFGLGFCNAYKQAANSTPREVLAGDIVAVDLTKQPIAVP